MNTSQNNPVLLNLRDSVSRIVHNLGFSSIDNTAHAKLVDVVAKKLYAMSQTCRLLTENAEKTAKSLNGKDIKLAFLMNNIDLESLLEYVKQVRPFPPKRSEIHGEAAFETENVRHIPVVGSVKKVPLKRYKPIKVSKLPVFDDMTDEDLGFNSISSPPHPPSPPLPVLSISTIFTPPAVPQPTQPVHKHVLEVPKFDPEVPPPPLPTLPSYVMPQPSSSVENVTSPVIPSFLVKQELVETPKIPKLSRSSEFLKPYPLEKMLSSSSMPSSKMTKKKRMQSKYERRLRDEQVAKEEKIKERRIEKKRLEVEMARRSAERESERGNKKNKEKDHEKSRIVFRFDPVVIEEMKRRKEPRPGIGEMDENDNTMKAKISNASNYSAGVDPQKPPLLKMNIKYRQTKRGEAMLIKKVISMEYHLVSGNWTSKENEWKCNRGVLSYPQSSRKPSLNEPISSIIPKLKLIRNADGEYEVKQ